MTAGRMDLGRLPQLMDLLASMASGIALNPVVEETGPAFGGLEPDDTVVAVTGWEITYETLHGRFTAAGKTVAEAVDEALRNPAAW